jgi:uncharacterized protein (TIGR03435 family)
MLQNLLIDRFEMSVHTKLRELSRSELVIAEGGVKLKGGEGWGCRAGGVAISAPDPVRGGSRNAARLS